MAKSVRLRTSNPQWYGSRVALTHPTQKLKPRFNPDGSRVGCFACGGIVHERKTIHLDVSSDGEIFVSPETYVLIKQAGLDNFGLRLDGDTDSPPDQVIQMAGAPVALTAFNQKSGARFPRLEVIKNRLLRPSVRAEEE